MSIGLQAAPSHTLFAYAVVNLGARWVASSTRNGTGEICMGGLCYGTHLDPEGIPVLTPGIREAIIRLHNRNAK